MKARLLGELLAGLFIYAMAVYGFCALIARLWGG